MSRRVLLGILVYNGREVVPACLDSAAQLVGDNVDVMVFDDCSPSEGWSAEVAALCEAREIGCYRSPRNLGIPRNMSLVMKTALANDYDVVGLVNSDVVLPRNIVHIVDAILDSTTDVGSITPWSNNASSFSLAMDGAFPQLANQDFVSRMSASLATVNGPGSMEIPTGVGYCLMIPTAAIRRVGVMDPIFGRGYCEEVDWCQRARLAGLKNLLSTGSFVYHEGSATNRTEGLLAHGMSTVVEHEKIVLGRYPDYMDRVEAFFDDGSFETFANESLAQALRTIMAQADYDLVIGDPRSSAGSTDQSVTISATDDSAPARLSLYGMSAYHDKSDVENLAALVMRFGRPRHVYVRERGPVAETFSKSALDEGIALTERVAYPARI